MYCAVGNCPLVLYWLASEYAFDQGARTNASLSRLCRRGLRSKERHIWSLFCKYLLFSSLPAKRHQIDAKHYKAIKVCVSVVCLLFCAFACCLWNAFAGQPLALGPHICGNLGHKHERLGQVGVARTWPTSHPYERPNGLNRPSSASFHLLIRLAIPRPRCQVGRQSSLSGRSVAIGGISVLVFPLGRVELPMQIASTCAT